MNTKVSTALAGITLAIPMSTTADQTQRESDFVGLVPHPITHSYTQESVQNTQQSVHTVLSQTRSDICNRAQVGQLHNARDHIFAHVGQGSDGKLYFTVCEYGKQVMRVLTSTGKPQRDGGVYTPEGTFYIGEKTRNRRSRSYNNAPMPYAQHLYKGIFIHAGKVNGGFISHGCIRLTTEDAKQFFEYSHRGMPVVIEDTRPARKPAKKRR